MRNTFFLRKPLDLLDRKTNGWQKNKKMDTWIRKKSDWLQTIEYGLVTYYNRYFQVMKNFQAHSASIHNNFQLWIYIFWLRDGQPIS